MSVAWSKHLPHSHDMKTDNSVSALSPPQQQRLAVFLRVWRDFVKTSERRRLLVAMFGLLVSSGTNLAFPALVGKGIDLMVQSEKTFNMKILVAATLSVFGMGALASWLRVYSFKVAGHRVEQRMRKQLFRALLLQESSLITEGVGDLNTRLLTDVEVASKAVTENVAHTLRGLNSTIGGTAMLLTLSPTLTLTALLLFPVLGSGLILYKQRIQRLQRQLMAQQAAALAYAGERLANLETVRLFGQEEHEAKALNTKIDDLYSNARRVAAADGLLMGGMSIAMNTSLLAVLLFGSALIRKGELSVGHLTSFALYSSMVGLGFASLSKVYTTLVKASVSADRVFEILDRRPSPLNEGTTLSKVGGEIEFQSVEFAYPSRPDTYILKKCSFTILPGQIVALAGASGSGKTTASRLLTRLFPVQAGTIKLDGHDISTLNPTWLREHVYGVVNQEPVLFDLSVAENIAYSNIDATMPDIVEAALKANAHEFIKELPEGYLTKVGERGCKLSVGQKQRIAIARALLKNPPCLILDEATASLDGESESLIQQALERLMVGRTTLVIAHQPTTLGCAHRIEVLKDGVIVESGCFTDLIKRPAGVFAALIHGAAGNCSAPSTSLGLSTSSETHEDRFPADNDDPTR